MKKNKESFSNVEDNILLDVESLAGFESIRPETVAVKGFGMECWDHKIRFGKPRKEPSLTALQKCQLPQRRCFSADR